ncbi:FkbM family methyltransferase [Bradyrhizobium yuanmingense]|uniref:FkbM family methyltransferase n=1 Tax=Bradyrhizobium yuanmingense TaxID=108015 RepID=UPI0023BA243F|nr:FkbM family methyltransferase [Bradyrhizobium yuanmingense]MDF0516822.1 FkbM family methyltransferase [Bradyrhizobium yuanmingense]
MLEAAKKIAKVARNAILFKTVPLQEHVKFLGVGDLHFNKQDNRGKAIAAAAGVTQRQVTKFWRLAVQQFSPTIILDVGANYGEIALSSRYLRGSEVHLFEANPALIPFLHRSIASHANADAVKLHAKLVSDSMGTKTFYVDEKWSGTSSAIGRIHDDAGFKGAGAESFKDLDVESVTIDSLFNSRTLSNDRLLFKIDVEGFEEKVLLGMSSTLSSVESFVGIMEFDKKYLVRAGSDPVKVFEWLKSIATVKVLTKAGVAPIQDEISDHADLIISSPKIAASGWLAASIVPFNQRVWLGLSLDKPDRSMR